MSDEMIDKWQRANNLTFVDRQAAIFIFDNVYINQHFNIFQDHFMFPIGYSDLMFWHGKPIEEKIGRIIIANPTSDNYYHCLIEQASRLMIINDQLMSHPQYSDVNILIDRSPFVEMVIDLLGLNRSRVIWQEYPKMYHASQVIALNWQMHEDDNDASIQRFMPPKWMLLELRKRILNNDRVKSAIDLYDRHNQLAYNNQSIILYMHRTGKSRFVDEDKWLIWKMRHLIDTLNNNNQTENESQSQSQSKEKRWRLVIHKGNEAIESQIAMFHSARIVIGPHGAATTNTLFCKPSTHMIEFPEVQHRGETTNYIAASVGLEYWITPHVWSTNWGFYKTDRWKLDSIIHTLNHVIHQFYLDINHS